MRRLPWLVGIAILAIAAVVLLFGSWYTIEQGKRGVILRNGATIGVAEPGWGFKLPIIDHVVELSVRTEKASYSDVQSYSKDIQAADLLLSVNYRIDPARVAEIYSDLGTGYVDSILTPAVLNAVKVVFGRYNAVSIVGERGKLSADMADAIREAVKDRGIVVESVQLENVDFSDAYEQSIEAACRPRSKWRAISRTWRARRSRPTSLVPKRSVPPMRSGPRLKPRPTPFGCAVMPRPQRSKRAAMLSRTIPASSS
jgi:regulator of protease activity HflC (stomatin/prohibitin superfamily)